MKYLKEYKKFDYLKGGLADNMSIEDIALYHSKKNNQSVDSFFYKDVLKTLQKNFNMGIKIELEHTSDKNLAKEITSDHLIENPNYYDLLKKYVEND